MKQAKNSRRIFTALQLGAITALSAGLSFTLLLFSPVLFYLDDPAAFMVDLRHIVVPMTCAAIVLTAALAGLLCLARLIHRWAYIVLSRLLLGLLLAFTVQGFLLNGRMDVVLSADVRYSEYRTRITVNNIVFFTLVLIPLIISVLALIFPKRCLKAAAGEKSLIATAAVLAALHMASASARTVMTDLDRYKGIQNYYLSYEPTMSLSEKGNVVVFLTDRLDSLWMDDMLELYPELYGEFDGFTFYQNATSTGTSTFPTVPQMLTNSEYDGEEWHEFLSDAWSGETVPSVLKSNGYDVYLLPDQITTLSSPAQVMGQCDNIKRYETDRRIRLFGRYGTFVTMFRLSFTRMAPYSFKHDLQYWLGANFSRGMIADPDCGEDVLPKQAFVDHDLKYYSYLITHGLRADNDSRVFSFIHLNCCHTVYDDTAALHGFEGENDVYKTTRGDFEILSEYFRQMKELGIYDNSTIIVMGDHGRAPRELECGSTVLNDAITTAVLIKPAGAEHGELLKDRETPLSLANFPASILEYAGVDHSSWGLSFGDIIRGADAGERWLRGYAFAGYGRMVYKDSYTINGDARNYDNWTVINE